MTSLRLSWLLPAIRPESLVKSRYISVGSQGKPNFAKGLRNFPKAHATLSQIFPTFPKKRKSAHFEAGASGRVLAVKLHLAQVGYFFSGVCNPLMKSQRKYRRSRPFKANLLGSAWQ